MALGLHALRDRVVHVPEGEDGLLDRPNVDDIERDELDSDVPRLQHAGHAGEQMPLNELPVGGEDQIDEVLPDRVDQFLPYQHGKQPERIGRREEVRAQVVDPVLKGHVHFDQVRVPGQQREVHGGALLARDAVSENPLDLANVHPFDERNAVVPARTDFRVDHLSEPGEYALLLLLDDVEAGAQPEKDGDGEDSRDDPPAVAPEEVERRVDCARAGRQWLRLVHHSRATCSGISLLSRYLNSSLSAGSMRVVFLSMMRS